MTETAQLAEVGKERITAAAAIELAKKFVKDRYKEDKLNNDRALAQARDFAGGQIERVDKDVVDQGRQWATRLAMISRRTAGSGYNTSRPAAALVPIVKKLYGLIGELEAMMATDTEISLFQKVDETEYFGYAGALKKLSVRELTEYCDPGETVEQSTIVEFLVDGLGEKVGDAVEELLGQYEIEPIVVPGEQEGAPANGKRPRRRRS
jgi:hypothetical protein